MRVAITGFGASWDGGKQFLTPQTRLSAPLPDFANPPVTYNELPFVTAVRHQLVQAELLSRRHIAWRMNPDRVGISYGSSKGDWQHFENCRVWADWSPHWAADWVAWPNKFSLDLASSLLISGPVMAPIAACATGSHAIALAALWIECGRADVVIAGAIEPPQPEIVLAAYKNMGALSPGGLMRPFDVRRDGFLPSNGDGFLILESESHARARNATIHGFLTGTSMKCDATHMTSMCPSGDSIARAIEEALKKAGNPRIDYINAHGTATKHNDLTEVRAIKLVFGRGVPVSSTKPLTGHLLGASGAVEAVICLLAMRENFAPPTLNLEEPDAEMDLDFVAMEGQKMEINAALSLSYGFGGHIGVLVLEEN